MSMYLMATPGEEVFESFGELLSFLDGTSREKIKRIWAVSAYYDIESIRQLIDHIKSCSSKKQKLELSIVVGTINSGELEVLQEIQKTEFGNEYKKGSGIRVTNCGLLFHSKGYLVETSRNGMCAIGSMNLTQAGLNRNVEILTCFQYKQARVPALVASFKEYIEACRSDGLSKEIGAVSEGEPGVRWLARNHPRDKSMQENEEFVQENDSNGWLPPEFPDIADESAVQQYFGGEEGLNFPPELNDPGFDNDRKFTLALYKLIFEECRKNPREYEHDGITLQYRDALWRTGFKPYLATWHEEVGNRMQHWVCSVRFDVTLKGEGLTCDILVYPYWSRDKSGFRGTFRGISLVVRVENKQKKVADLQLLVSKPGWGNIWNDEGQYWEIYSDASMGQTKREVVLSAVRKTGRDRWIKKPSWSKKELVHLGKLPVAEKVTWRNSRDFLARLLRYEIIRAKIKFSRAK